MTGRQELFFEKMGIFEKEILLIYLTVGETFL